MKAIGASQADIVLPHPVFWVTLTNADRVFGYIQSLDKSTGLVTRPPNGLRSSEGYCLRVMLLDFQLFVVKPQPLVV